MNLYDAFANFIRKEYNIEMEKQAEPGTVAPRAGLVFDRQRHRWVRPRRESMPKPKGRVFTPEELNRLRRQDTMRLEDVADNPKLPEWQRRAAERMIDKRANEYPMDYSIGPDGERIYLKDTNLPYG